MSLLDLTADQLGIPTYPAAACPDNLDLAEVVSWIPDMKADLPVTYFAQYRRSEIRKFLAKGGDINRMIVHHMAFDAGCIDPLWGPGLLRRAEDMQKLGVRYVVAPDFSTWTDMPMAAQIHNVYRSAVVTADLIKAGFQVIPHNCSPAPQLRDMALSVWPAGLPYMMIDGQHVNLGRHDYNQRLFWDDSRRLVDQLRPRRIILYANIPAVVARWRETIGDCVWVPTRAYSIRMLDRQRAARKKAA